MRGLRKRHGRAARRSEGRIEGFKRDPKRLYWVSRSGEVMSVQRKNA